MLPAAGPRSRPWLSPRDSSRKGGMSPRRTATPAGCRGIICLWGTCTCWEFRRNPWATGTQQSKTLVPELVMLLGRVRVKCIRLQHPKLDLVANLRKAIVEVVYTSGRDYLITK